MCACVPVCACVSVVPGGRWFFGANAQAFGAKRSRTDGAEEGAGVAPAALHCRHPPHRQREWEGETQRAEGEGEGEREAESVSVPQ